MNARVQIIEPQDDLRAFLSSYLSDHFTTWSGRSGLEALKLLHSGILPDLVVVSTYLSDIPTPDFISSLRGSGLFASMPIIVLETSEEAPGAEAYFRSLGVDYFFRQPFDPAALLTSINEQMSFFSQF
jgi:CheY-like chemotaxis protein